MNQCIWDYSIESPCTPDLSLSASQEHHSIKSSTSQFYLYWIIPISIKMCCLFPPFLLSVTTHFSIPLQQDPKEEAATPWCHFPLIFSNPLQSGFSVALNLWPYVVNSQPLPYLTYKWHVISLIHFFHLDSSMAHTLPGFPPILLVVPTWSPWLVLPLVFALLMPEWSRDLVLDLH